MKTASIKDIQPATLQPNRPKKRQESGNERQVFAAVKNVIN